jgi:Rrf2 family protein
MRITYKGDYAMKALLDLSIHYGEGPVQIHDLAKRTDAPVKFLEQVLLELKRGGFVESRRGKEGGYLLAKPPADISVGAVARFIDGPLDPIACLADGYAGCRDLHRCVFRGVWRQVAEATSNIIDNVSFESLAVQLKQKQNVLEYAI